MKNSTARTLNRSEVKGNAMLWYRSVVNGLDSILKGSKSSRKTLKRHKKATKAVRKFLKRVLKEEGEAKTVEQKKSAKPVKADKVKAKSRVKTANKSDNKKTKKAKASDKAKAFDKAKVKNKQKIQKIRKNKPVDPLLLTSDDTNVVQLRSPEKLIGQYDTEKASDIMSLTPQPDVALSNSLDKPDGEPDDLKMIAGVGPKLEELLNGLGIFHFQQIADWERRDVIWVDNYLQFTGRIDRDNWVEQAIALAKGGRDEYVKVFGKEPR